MKHFLGGWMILLGVFWLADAPWWQEIIAGTLILVGLDARDDS